MSLWLSGRAWDGAPLRNGAHNQKGPGNNGFVTHDVTEIPFLADRTVIMAGGKIIADGPVRDACCAKDLRGALSQLAGAANWLLKRVVKDEMPLFCL